MDRPVVLAGDQGAQATLHYGVDARVTLRTLPEKSVHCVVTSPPYWGLRDYQSEGQLGQEPTPAEYIQTMVDVFREVRRVLRDDGTAWLNLGDSYATDSKWGGTTGGKHSQGLHGSSIGRGRTYSGLKDKNLVGIPWRVAFALQEDGWYIRSDIIWSKVNPMPEPVVDRPTKSHEYVFLLTLRDRYYYDADAIREAHDSEFSASAIRLAGGAGGPRPAGNNFVKETRRMEEGSTPSTRAERAALLHPGGRNKRTVWSLNTSSYKGAHFATMPPKLVEPCVLAGTSERGCCPTCGEPWTRVVTRRGDPPSTGASIGGDPNRRDGGIRERDPGGAGGNRLATLRMGTNAWTQGCECAPHEPVPCVVLDPFSGSGTVGFVALQKGRSFLGLDINPDYLPLAQARILGEPPPSEKREEDRPPSVMDLF